METAVIVSLIAAIAAICAPVVSAVVTAVSTRRLKTIELFFQAKVTAYQDFLAKTSYLLSREEMPDYDTLRKSEVNAYLFSSQKTRRAISDYFEIAAKEDFEMDDVEEYSRRTSIMLLAMQEDLARGKPKRKR